MLITHLNSFLRYMGRAIKNHIRIIETDYKKVLRVIKSCQCEEHLDVTNKLITYFHIKHKNDFLLKNLKKRFRFKKKLINKL